MSELEILLDFVTFLVIYTLGLIFFLGFSTNIGTSFLSAIISENRET
jgi:hypothetical protein